MARYFRKPEMIEAVQYRDWMRENDMLPEGVYICSGPADKPVINLGTPGTGEYLVVITDGDWITTDAEGHIGTCSNEYFKETYQPG